MLFENCQCWLQRLHRIITSEELVSPHHSAREMIEVMKNRDFAKLFQKSVRKVSELAANYVMDHSLAFDRRLHSDFAFKYKHLDIDL